MMGRQTRGQEQLFYEFSLDEVVPADHLVLRIDAVLSLANIVFGEVGAETISVRSVRKWSHRARRMLRHDEMRLCQTNLMRTE